MNLHIGVDFDNTIVCYDDVFYLAAIEQNLLPAGPPLNKIELRNYFRSSQRENEWTALQGYVYGKRMDLAKSFPGIDRFFEACKNNGVKISIISHKTKTPYLGPQYDLHTAARKWLAKQPFFHDDIDVYFELTLQEKLERISHVECGLFIDDLPELLNEPNFPKNVAKILFDPNNHHTNHREWTTLASWDQAHSILSKHLRF